MKTDRQNHKIAWYYFKAIGKIPKNAKPQEWCLHHVDTTLKYTDRARYDEWRIEDLVPMKMADHAALHWKDEAAREIRRRKISEAKKGKPGHAVSEETRQKISATLTGHEVPEETKAKISSAQKGKKIPDEVIRKRLETYRANHPPKPEREKGPDRRKGLLWITNGVENKRIAENAEIPAGWHRGRLGFARKSNPKLGPMSEDHKQKISAARAGMKFTEEHCRHLSEAHKKSKCAVDN